MTRLELLTVLLSIKALLESDNKDKALELINEVIAEAKQKRYKVNITRCKVFHESDGTLHLFEII